MLVPGVMAMLVLLLAAGLIAGLVGGAAALLLAAPRRWLGRFLWLAPLGAAVLGGLVCGAGTGGRAVLALPLGLPGYGAVLTIDGLAGFFLLASGVALAAVLRLVPPARPAAAALLAGFYASLLAADGFTLIAALAATLVALWRLVAAGRGVVLAGIAGLGALLLALARLAPLFPDGAPDAAFSAMRAAPQAGARGAAIVALALLGAGLIALPLLWPARLGRRAAHEAALIVAVLVPSGLYLVLRFTGDLAALGAAPGQEVIIVAGGAALMLGGAREALLATALGRIAAAAGLALFGEAILACGVAALARGADLTDAAHAAASAALLLVFLASLAPVLLLLVAAVLRAAAGTEALARLGGLAPRLPFTAASALAGASALAALPPGPGFAAMALLLGTLWHLPRIGGGAGAFGAALLVALLGAGLALGVFAMLRFLGLGFLGPPRTPRASAATESDRPACWVLGGLAGLLALAGVAPGLILWLASPALAVLLPAAAAVSGGLRPGWLAWLAPPLLAGLLAALVALMQRLRGDRADAARPEAAWQGGYGPPPRWLPFGDPATLIDPACFTASWRCAERPLGAALARLARRPRAAWRAGCAAWWEG